MPNRSRSARRSRSAPASSRAGPNFGEHYQGRLAKNMRAVNEKKLRNAIKRTAKGGRRSTRRRSTRRH